MNEIYIDLRCDDELEEIFPNKDLITVEELRNKLVELFNQMKVDSEYDPHDMWLEHEEGIL